MMPIIESQAQRDALIEFIRDAFRSLNGKEPVNPNKYADDLEEYTKKVFEIALAALESKPTDFLGFGEGDAEYNGIRHFSFKPETIIDLYHMPPVPVLKPVKFVPELNPLMFNDDVIFGYRKARKEDEAAVRAAGYPIAGEQP